MERIGMRAAEFVGTTVRRVVRAAGDVIPVDTGPSRVERLTKTVLPVAGAAVAAAGLARKAVTRKSTGASRKSTGAKATRAAGSNGAYPSSPARSNGKLADKTREELYQLARKADISGRSSMSKEELLKALDH